MPARRGGKCASPSAHGVDDIREACRKPNAAQAAVANVLSKGGLKRNGNSVCRGPWPNHSCSRCAVFLSRHTLPPLGKPQRNTSPYPRNTHFNPSHRIQSKDRVQSKDGLQPLQQKRAQTPLSSKKQLQSRKAGFSIARSDDTDEDEWISSESGAATPLRVDDEHDDKPRRNRRQRQWWQFRHREPSKRSHYTSRSRCSGTSKSGDGASRPSCFTDTIPSRRQHTRPFLLPPMNRRSRYLPPDKV